MPKKIDTITYIDPETGERATRQVEVDFKELPVIIEAVKIGGGKSVNIQIGPTPGNAFAVYAKNIAFHDDEPEAWARAARQALEVWAGKKNLVIEHLINEHGRSMNLKLEYVV